MRRLLLAVALVVAVSNVAFAAPCLPNPLAGYIGLGPAGCEIGTSTFFNFSSGPSFFGGAEISPSTISVIPILTGPGFDFVTWGDSCTGRTGTRRRHRLLGDRIRI